MNIDIQRRKPGRPRAIDENSVPLVLSLYETGLGYRAITRELREYAVLVSFSSVRRVIKENLNGPIFQKGQQTNSDTILKLSVGENPT